MFCKTSYDTTAGKITVMKKVDLAIKEALISGALNCRYLGVAANPNVTPVFVIGEREEATIPAFIHPYLVENFKGKNYLVSDMRQFRDNNTSASTDREFEIGVRNKTEYMMAKARAVLSTLWLEHDVSRVRSQFTFAGTVFGAWLSQAISKAYALDFGDQLKLTAIAIYYYHLLFQPEPRLTDYAMEAAVIHTIKATKLPAPEVYSLFEKIGDIHNVSDFCTQIKNVVENVRLDTFSLAMLLTLIRNTWYGSNSKELLSVALEHPPTWITIVYATLTERSFKASSLYKIIEVQGKRGGAEDFRLNFQQLVMTSITATESMGSEELVIRPFE